MAGLLIAQDPWLGRHPSYITSEPIDAATTDVETFGNLGGANALSDQLPDSARV
jgi:hypothetical protein